MSHSDQKSEHSDSSGMLGTLPGLARVAATAWWHGAEWAVSTSLKTGLWLLDAIVSPDRTARRVAHAVPLGPDPDPDPEADSDSALHSDDATKQGSEAARSSNGVPRSLEEEGELLLRRSRDVNYEVAAHPAYEHILSELTPDEGRILRLLLLEGPQPSVDIRTGGPLGMVNSRLVAPGLSMIGARAGCRYVERVPSYLNNLFRLGLVWFSRETLPDPMRYQVLEAQPDVLEAIHSVPHAKVVRRSIHLTPFGEDFCRVCLTPEPELSDELPHHSIPRDHETAPQLPDVGDD